MATHWIVRVFLAVALLSSGCKDERVAQATPDPESRAVKALLNGLHFAGGVARLGRIQWRCGGRSAHPARKAVCL
jgi:hypothetical protein